MESRSIRDASTLSLALFFFLSLLSSFCLFASSLRILSSVCSRLAPSSNSNLSVKRLQASLSWYGRWRQRPDAV
jgi:hypothetical protein